MYAQRYERWLANVEDETLKKELLSLNQEQIENAFFKELSFGTGGLRGVLGVGTNCMNIYTVDKATEGLCKVLNRKGAKSVVVCYDSRNNSKLFAERAATVFARHCIEVLLTFDIFPVSFLSFAVRKTGADAGVMITASHNPAIYNGYKVYESDGCQCTDVSAKIYAEAIYAVDEFAVKHADFEEALQKGTIRYVSQDLVDDYKKEVFALDYCPLDGLKLVYTPLNGAGYKVVPEVLREKGASVVTVEEQSKPDGDFPTCPSPNPEKREALLLGLAKAKETFSPLLIATDPDCDRVGVAVLHKGKYVCLTGNEVGALLADFVLSQKNPPSYVFKTIVTSDLGAEIAKKYSAEVKDVLTGFKYIGEQVGLLQKAGKESCFALGYEESYGYLLTPAFRDKDGVGSCYVICQMANYFAKQGKTLVDRIRELYDEYGLYTHKTASFEFGGASGNVKMKLLLEKLREIPLRKIGKHEVKRSIDYLTQTEQLLPKADVLSYYLDSAKVIVRPSGTEPLVKVYLTAIGRKNAKLVDELEKDMARIMEVN